MKFKTNKEKGNTGLGMAIAYFTSKGYTVSIPMNDTQDYDLIVELDGILNKVQVKSTSYEKSKGSYEVALRSTGGTNGKVYKTFIDTDVDYLFVFCVNMDMYFIPKNMVTNKNSIRVFKEKSKFCNKDILDTSEFLVTF